MQVNELPLYPNETLLWDENLVPLGQYYGGKVMALPKLNLQFLTSHDYLLRSGEQQREFVGCVRMSIALRCSGCFPVRERCCFHGAATLHHRSLVINL